MNGPLSLLTFLGSATVLPLTKKPAYGTTPMMELKESIDREQVHYLDVFRRMAKEEVTFQKFPSIIWGWQCPDKERVFTVEEIASLNGISLAEYMKRYSKAMLFINRGILGEYEWKPYEFTSRENSKSGYRGLSKDHCEYCGTEWNFINEKDMLRQVLFPIRNELLALRRKERE